MFSSNTSTSGGATYIEDVFSTYLYTGTAASQTINNGIDLAGKGGLVWLKPRNVSANHILVDTARTPTPSGGVISRLFSNLTNAASDGSLGWSWNNNGFTNTVDTYNWASWTFRKQPKFFDIVTWTGDGVPGRQITHQLGSVPGCIIVKNTSNAATWNVWHRSMNTGGGAGNAYILLNSTQQGITDNGSIWGNVSTSTYIAPTSTNFTISGVGGEANASGNTYVAYLFAHNAGGFGLTGTDNVISCGSLTGSNPTNYVNLGYEPQWLLVKQSNGVGNWYMYDTMRGWTASGSDAVLEADLTNAEATISSFYVDATGFGYNGNLAGLNYIYIAIRRGPMKTPTSGASVFAPTAMSGTYAANTNYVTTGFPVDWTIDQYRLSGASQNYASTRLTNATLGTQLTSAESTAYAYSFQSNTGMQRSSGSYNTNNTVNWSLQRAPGFFDVVCYTGTGVNGATVNHNLGVVPEWIIYKSRSTAESWWVCPASSQYTPYTTMWELNAGGTALSTGTAIGSVTSTSLTVGSVGFSNQSNASGVNYVMYLFATCPGVSKVGSYTGTGATQTISCGFTGGARFVLIKRADGTGDWYVWDTARGMVAGTDPNLQLNTTNAETNTNSIYTTTGGFQIVSTAAGINASGGTYIYLAIA